MGVGRLGCLGRLLLLGGRDREARRDHAHHLGHLVIHPGLGVRELVDLRLELLERDRVVVAEGVLLAAVERGRDDDAVLDDLVRVGVRGWARGQGRG